MRSSTIISGIAAVGITLSGIVIAGMASAQAFPFAGDDTTTSLGQFRVLVDTPFRDVMKGVTGYDDTTHKFTSPLLYDGATTIGRSNAFIGGSQQDIDGVSVGSAGTIVKQGDYTNVPDDFKNTGRREVATEITSVNLTALDGSGFAVHMGSKAMDQPRSVGEVQSKSTSGNPSDDFPARSFFDVFVDVVVPGLGVLHNSDALVVQNPDLNNFPPKVVYTHDASSAVAIYFNSDNSMLGIHKGDRFGWLVLAGHGVGYGNNASDMSAFNTSFASLHDAPVVPEGSTLVSMGILLTVMGGFVMRRRPR